MTQLQLIKDADAYAVWFSFIVAMAFPLLTSLIWPWWRHVWGVNIVTLEAAIALALLPPWLRLVFHLTFPNFFFDWIQLASVVLVGIIISWRMVLIWRNQRRPPHREDAP